MSHVAECLIDPPPYTRHGSSILSLSGAFLSKLSQTG